MPVTARRSLAARFRTYIESRSGLQFGDALNVALFLLTLFSLVLAGYAIKIAKDTLSDARSSGKEQGEALQSAKDSLLTLQQEIAAQQAIIVQQTSVLKTQLNSLNDVLKTSRSQLRLAQAEAAKHPDIQMSLQCSTPSREEVVLATVISARDLQLGDYSGKIKLGRSELMLCKNWVENRGTTASMDTVLGWFVSRWVYKGIYRTRFDDWHEGNDVPGFLPFEDNGSAGTPLTKEMELMKGGQVFPISQQHETCEYKNNGTAGYAFYIQVPMGVEEFTIVWWFRGANLPEDSFPVTFKIER